MTATGNRPYPVLFRPAGTRLLMYLAGRPNSSTTEIGAALGLRRVTVQANLCRILKPKGIVVHQPLARTSGIKLRFEINPALSGFAELFAFLTAQAKAHQMPGSESPWPLPDDSVTRSLPMPRNLFWTTDRTSLLIVVCALREMYAQEALGVLRMTDMTTRSNLHQLVDEGVLKFRVLWQVKYYSVNKSLPGADALEALLGRMLAERPDLRAAGNSILARRQQVATQCTVREARMIASLPEPKIKALWRQHLRKELPTLRLGRHRTKPEAKCYGDG